MTGEINRLIGFAILLISVFACIFMTNRRKRDTFSWVMMALVLPITGFVVLML